MSLEQAIKDLTEAMEEHTKIIKGMSAKAKGATAAKDDEDKPARTRTTKPKLPTVKEISTATTDYLAVDDQDEYDARASIIKKIVSKYGVKKMSEIEDADRAEAMNLLNIAIEGGNPFPKKPRPADDEDYA